MNLRKDRKDDLEKRIIDYASTCEVKAKQFLNQLLSKGEIDEEAYNELIIKNEELRKQFIKLASSWKPLSSREIIGSVGDLLKTASKPQTEEEVILTIRKIVCEDSRNVRLRQIASNLERIYSTVNNLPSPPPMGIDRLYDMPPYVDESGVNFIQHCNGIAIYEARWVCENVSYISEADDVFQRSLHTLEVVGGGDCDDYSILVCSLLRSIGYEAYVGLMPGHMYPGVILCRTDAVSYAEARDQLSRMGLNRVLSKLPRGGRIFSVRQVKVPLDRPFIEYLATVPLVTTIGDFSDITIELLDFLSGGFNDKLMQVNDLIKSLERSRNKNLVDEVVQHVKDSLSRLSGLLKLYKYSKTMLVQCDAPRSLEAVDLYDIFYQDVSKFLD